MPACQGCYNLKEISMKDFKTILQIIFYIMVIISIGVGLAVKFGLLTL